MGADFNLCDAHLAYSGFHRFREKLAKEICIDLNLMDGFGGNIRLETINDDIKLLLNHSDCD